MLSNIIQDPLIAAALFSDLQFGKEFHQMSKQSAAQGLDCELETFRNDLQKAADLIVQLYGALDHARITPAKTRMEIASLFDEPFAEEPQPMGAILREVENKIFANSTLYLSPRFFGYINSGGNQASILGELLASAVNQICAMWHFSPAASEVERRVIRWIAQFIGYAPEAGGCLLSGGSAGNLVGLAVARKQKAQFDTAALGMRGGPPVTVYVSREGHASLEKGMVLLGMGRNQLRRIAVRDDFTIDLDSLEKHVTEDRRNGYCPICVVGNAGTTNTGSVDPLDELAEFCRDQDLWFHVDAAYGGPAACTKAAGKLFRGLDRADSGEESETGADGPLDFKDYGPQLHRNFRALKVWMTFKAYGARKLRAAIESNIEIMRYLADRIDQSQDFVRLAPVPLSVVCFQYRTTDIFVRGDQKYLDELNNELLKELEKDGRVFLSGTKINGKSVLRACSVNHRLRREDVDFLLDVVREVGRSLIAARNPSDATARRNLP